MSIRSLNLDSMFVPTAIPEIEFKMMKFQGGELHIKLNMNINYSVIDKVVITNRLTCSDDIIEVLIAKDALERLGIKEFDLIIPYIPYARQDRTEIEGESFTLKVFADLINSAKFDNVKVFDSHSDVAPALINKCTNKKNHDYVLSAFSRIVENNPDLIVPYPNVDPTAKISILNTIRSGHYVLISPDSGANKKINKLHEFLDTATKHDLFKNSQFNLQIVKCDKRRNFNDGSLGGFDVMCDDLQGKPCIIVDDICSRGGTFMGLATELKKKNAGDIYLIVSHYENCADESKLKESGIKQVYKTNSMNDYKNDFIQNINLYY